MKSLVLIPYCPFPADTGSKVEMLKHLSIVRTLGGGRVLSAAGKPVGVGWNPGYQAELEKQGFDVVLREKDCSRSAVQWAGITYAAACKVLCMERAFGHSNPYHRYAFPREWWLRHTEDVDIAFINYSYWAWLPCKCPKVVVLHDLLSGYMWEGAEKEIEDLSTADLVVVISREEEAKLHSLGICKTLWSPPAVKHVKLPLTCDVGCIGSANKLNMEGLRWFERAAKRFEVRFYGELARKAVNPGLGSMQKYLSSIEPYRDCGIILLPTGLGMGVQVKAIEALAYGRAIVARKGAMRGLPEGHGAWIEVEKPEEMVDAAMHFKTDADARLRQAEAALAYYRKFLSSDDIISTASNAYRRLVEKTHFQAADKKQ